MYYYEEMKNLDGEDLEAYIQERIQELELEAQLVNSNESMIGYELGYNPVRQLNDKKELFIDVHNFYGGYIPKNMKIVYGLSYNYEQDGLVGNDGKYYYLDTEDYIYEFCRLIKEKEILDESELFYHLEDFLKQYFGLLPTIDREEMFALLYKDKNTFYKPIKEHGFSWFKGKGNAMCMEYAIVVQNILSFFGMDSYLMIAREKMADSPAENHAFNFLSYQEAETGEENNMLIDFATPIGIYNTKFEFVGEFPFIGPIDTLDEDFIQRILSEEERLTFSEYCYQIIGDVIIEVDYPKKREYYMSSTLMPDSIHPKENRFILHKKH